MDRWLAAALDYVPRWLEFQMEASQQPGCLMAIAYRDKIVLERAFGYANLDTREALTPRHRFRVASHSKSFTAAGIMRLREQGKLRLDDTAGQFVSGLHRDVARVTIAQLLSHSAGLVRDGGDAGQFHDRRPFYNASELLTHLKEPPIIEPGARFKYSNHAYGLLGLMIEAITGEAYRPWITREIIAAAGLRETTPDAPIRRGTPFARGHSGRMLLGRRVVIPGDNPTHAIAPAGGFVSTASDIARFFAQLAPTARRSVLSAASRREMTRRQWRNPNTGLELYYGLGTMSGSTGGWDWFGHSGGLQGYISRTCVYPSQELTVSILTNAVDGWAPLWGDGIVSIMQAFARDGAPNRKVRNWNGRFWALWGALDLVPTGDKVLALAPGFINPFPEASEIAVTGRNTGRIAAAPGFGSHGEKVTCTRAKSGRITEVWVAGGRYRPAARAAREMEALYGKPARGRRRK